MKILSVYVVIMMLALALSNCRQPMQNTFYVDSKQGHDLNPGSIEKPFQSIDKALSIVSDPKFYNVNAFDFRIGNKELKYLEVSNAEFWKNIRDNFPNEIKQE